MMKPDGTAHPWVVGQSRQVRFGTGLPEPADWVKSRDFAQAIEDLGFDSGIGGEHPSFGSDGWISLAAYAAVTHRLRLVSISCVYYRSAQLLVRHATDVDRLSGGRLVLGLGAGWAKGDFDYLGIPFPPIAERVRHLEETIRTVRQLWADPPTVTSELNGRTFTMRCDVDPVQQPYVPLLVAGAGEKAILRQVAEYADMANIEASKAPTPGDVRRKLDVVRGYCAARGRSVDAVVPSHYVNRVILGANQDEANRRFNALPSVLQNLPFLQAMTPRDLIRYYQPIIDAGIKYIYFCPLDMDVPTARLFAETVMPELRDYYASTRP